MDTLPTDLFAALINSDTHHDKPSSAADLVDKNQDGLAAPLKAAHSPAAALPPQSLHQASQQDIQLPAEILLYILNLLSIPQLLPCQQVSRSFRAATRTVLMDRLGGPSHLRQCPVCRQHPYLPHQQLQQCAMSTSGIHLGSVAALTERELAWIGGGLSLSNTSSSLGLPPLPQNHQSNLTHHPTHPQQPVQQHQLHHHLYQRQDPSDAMYHQTDLHLHHPPLHHHYIQRQQFHHDAGYVAPGTLALFLFPHHDHTPTGWQDRQAVHLHCTGVDRAREQLVFQPMVAERDGGIGVGGGSGNGAVLRFNTNSWNLPTFGSLSPPTPLAVSMASTLLSSSASSTSSGSSSSSGSASHSRSNSHGSTNSIGHERQTTSTTTTTTTTTTGTGLNLFDYTTGHPRQTQHLSSTLTTGASFGNHEQSNQDERSQRPSAHTRSPCLSSPASSSSPSSSSSSTSINRSRSTTTPSWATVNGAGGGHYSVIGVKHGDWPEDRQAAGRWWGGGLHSSMTRESMVFLSCSRGSSGAGSATNHQQRMLRQEMENVAPATRSLAEEETTRHGHRSWDGKATKAGVDDDDDEEVCAKVHVHKMYLSSSQAHRPPRHHYRFLCLHHDQLMRNIATSDAPGKTTDSIAGSRHLAVEYGARVLESKRCLFCLSSPCKANLEIQLKFDQVRVSLDWILSGFVPEARPRPQND